MLHYVISLQGLIKLYWNQLLLCLLSTDKAQLCLFGSSKNGFGFRDSDLDICMTLEGHETAEVSFLNTHTAVSGIRHFYFWCSTVWFLNRSWIVKRSSKALQRCWRNMQVTWKFFSLWLVLSCEQDCWPSSIPLPSQVWGTFCLSPQLKCLSWSLNTDKVVWREILAFITHWWV